jgi:hypothetical protein
VRVFAVRVGLRDRGRNEIQYPGPARDERPAAVHQTVRSRRVLFVRRVEGCPRQRRTGRIRGGGGARSSAGRHALHRQLAGDAEVRRRACRGRERGHRFDRWHRRGGGIPAPDRGSGGQARGRRPADHHRREGWIPVREDRRRPVRACDQRPGPAADADYRRRAAPGPAPHAQDYRDPAAGRWRSPARPLSRVGRTHRWHRRTRALRGRRPTHPAFHHGQPRHRPHDQRRAAVLYLRQPGDRPGGRDQRGGFPEAAVDDEHGRPDQLADHRP